MIRKAIVFAAVLALAVPAMAGGVWNEQGDAPELIPGQEVTGSGDLAEIFGSFTGADDADLYQIVIKDAGAFSASTVDRCNCDTQLFLFDSDGIGVSADDDNEDPGQGLTSLLTDQFVVTEGVYFLGVSHFDRDPLNGAGDEIWNDTPFREERQPDGPGAPGPVVSWAGSGGGADDYSIALTGVSFVPEPSSLALLGLGGFALLRRRK